MYNKRRLRKQYGTTFPYLRKMISLPFVASAQTVSQALPNNTLQNIPISLNFSSKSHEIKIPMCISKLHLSTKYISYN